MKNKLKLVFAIIEENSIGSIIHLFHEQKQAEKFYKILKLQDLVAPVSKIKKIMAKKKKKK